ncbi:YeeE/YedE family protein [Gilvimarinus agarilyticus]|uniref:DUF6691 family protein n=1 Tax=unclassified Gilvimarinus TaxID=2642066 RepID=UPI001C0899BE|nr:MULTISPECIES: DUF6691 family protein [unclassified Gilvimarinus]MBU2885582.1 YeeE/YedE family protein [Gilvimarinus agarilyticus]MDO6570449.1 YeeE/YedE family protein [Gilvimarinus sp. 2_MG-2023]MDO6746501.1 YeeE/YedE family protein [Gilvimarinus sp. 1_MG-2023]
MKNVLALLCGSLFGAGLAISGMTDTAKVLGFLDLFGAWDPTLMFVMGGAVAATVVGFPLVLKCRSPVCEDRFMLPSNRQIDGKLLAGAALFGVGWGIYGYCPGPALSALVYLDVQTFAFVAAMLVGMASVALVQRLAR